MPAHTRHRTFTRRSFIKTSAATGAALAAGTVFAPAVHAQARAIKLGYVSPQTGPLAAFAEADNFVLGNFREAMKGGIKIGNATRPVEVMVKDSQSNPNRAAEVAKELIVRDKVDLMLVASTPETTNPVCTQCEIEEVACVSTKAPWQPWFIGQQANPAGGPPAWKPFNYVYHYFWGLEDVIAVFTNMWSQVATNKSVGALFPNDGDGNAWGDKQVGFPPVLEKQGYKLDRSRPLPEPHRQLLGPDHRLQERQLRDRHRRGAAARLHHLLEAGAAAGLQAEGRLGRQGASCSRSPSRRWARTATTCPRRCGGRRAIPSSPRSTAERQAAGRRLRRPPPRSSGRSRSASSTRCSRWRPTCSSARPRSATPRRRWRRSPPPTSTPSSARSQWNGAGLPPFAAKNVDQDAAGRRPVAHQGRQQVRHRHHRQQDRARHSRRRQDGSDRLRSRTLHGAGPHRRPRRSIATMLLEIRRLSKSFGSLKAADGIDLERRPRRGGRHHRAERRRQVDACSI